LHQRHAHEALLALLPPTPRRGLVLLDPSYEVKSEYQQMTDLLHKAVTKWPQGSFMLWYPLLESERHLPMLRQLAALDVPQMLGEWRWRESWHEDSQNLPAKGMLGSGLLVLNPPWQMDTFLDEWQTCLCDWFPGSRAKHEALHVEG
jgi:23S rRNA (adenine2030-N6)-methyltransferase